MHWRTIISIKVNLGCHDFHICLYSFFVFGFISCAKFVSWVNLSLSLKPKKTSEVHCQWNFLNEIEIDDNFNKNKYQHSWVKVARKKKEKVSKTIFKTYHVSQTDSFLSLMKSNIFLNMSIIEERIIKKNKMGKVFFWLILYIFLVNWMLIFV